MTFKSHHLECFNKVGAVGTWSGKNPTNWFNSVSNKVRGLRGAENLPSDAQSRDQLFNYIASGDHEIRECCISILAWGGMRVTNGVLLFAGSDEWLEVSKEVKNGNLNRRQAYGKFKRLRDKGALPGMGPAYFTKLIFFLTPRCQDSRGYIMDQWTSASVNLLSRSPIVSTQLTSSSNGSLTETVSDLNTDQNYESFCVFVEAVAKNIKNKVRPEEVEQMMFSQGGKNKGAWRRYVIDQRAQAS